MDLNSHLRLMILTTAAVAAMALPTLAQDVEGSSDHPVISRFDGAVISAYQVSDFDAVLDARSTVASNL